MSIAEGVRRVAIIAAASALCACTVGDLDLAGKGCPCPADSGTVCDESTQTCVAGPGCRFTVSDFGPDWSTSHNVRWTWTPNGTEETFGSYAMELATSADALAAGEPEQVFDQQTLAELGRYALLNTGDVGEVVNASVTYDLTPDTTWYGRLVVTDRFGCTSRTAAAPATTLPGLVREVVLFDDDPVPEAQLEWSHGTFAFDDDCDGEACLVAVAGENLTNNLRVWPEAPAELFAMMSPGQFEAQAFLEMRIWLEDPSASYWTSVWLELGVPTPPVYRFEPYSPIRTPPEAAQSSYRTVQIPLRTLLRDELGTPMTFADLQAAGVIQLSFGTFMPLGARAWLDDLRIRW